MKRRVFLLALAALPFSTLAAPPPGYYPAQTGISWRYSNGETQRLEAARVVRGVTVTPLSHVLGGVTVSQDLMAYRPDGVYLHGVQVGTRVSWYSPPLQVYPAAPLSPGQTWTSGTAALQLSGRVMGTQAIRTQAGSYNTLVIRSELRTSSGAGNVQYSYFVPGLGVVRYQGSDGGTVDLLR
ncbi:hypothetical protein [Deinococcus sonorensis]|uniref:Uncharacterized protein n=2 Tax=Deinococcus sonorensis TaxID=309891 RepID=A0AAU7UAI9_9DEIO